MSAHIKLRFLFSSAHKHYKFKKKKKGKRQPIGKALSVSFLCWERVKQNVLGVTTIKAKETTNILRSPCLSHTYPIDRLDSLDLKASWMASSSLFLIKKSRARRTERH